MLKSSVTLLGHPLLTSPAKAGCAKVGRGSGREIWGAQPQIFLPTALNPDGQRVTLRAEAPGSHHACLAKFPLRSWQPL